MQKDLPAAPAAIVRGLEAAVPGLALAALLLALIAPRATPGLLAVLALPPVALAALLGRLERPARLTPLEIAVAAFGGYLAINAAWSVAPLEAYGKVALFWLYAALISLAATALPALEHGMAGLLRRSVLVGIAIGAVYLAVETVLDQPLKVLVTNLLPFLRPSAKHVTVEDGVVTAIGSYVLNRNLAILILLSWPALLLLRTALEPHLARAAAGGLVVLTAAAVFSSQHETSMLAFVGSGLVFAGMVLVPRVTRIVVLAGWIAATLLVVPIAATAYKSGLYRAEWIPKTGRNRIVLWGVTANRVADKPLLGVGLGSTKPLDEEAAERATWPKDHPYPLRTGRHSHNVYMQTWYELGGIGALLLLGMGLALLRCLARLPADVQPYAYASMVVVMTIGAFSWGMWQPWFMAAFGFWAFALLLAIDWARRRAATA